MVDFSCLVSLPPQKRPPGPQWIRDCVDFNAILEVLIDNFFGTAGSRTEVPLSLRIVSLTLNHIHRPSSSALEIRNAHFRPCMHLSTTFAQTVFRQTKHTFEKRLTPLQIPDINILRFSDYVYCEIKLQMSKTSGCNLSYTHSEPTTPSEFLVLASAVTKEKANLCYESGIHNEA
jgi:hypothetical protein